LLSLLSSFSHANFASSAQFLSRGNIEKDHEDFMSHVYGTYTSEGLHHRLSLKSAYSHINELPFTNYTPGFQGSSLSYYTILSFPCTVVVPSSTR
jgi:mRNA deadenylase 3'-5' endonuclease subunit Ccr4